VLVSSHWQPLTEGLLRPYGATDAPPDLIAALALTLLHEVGHVVDARPPETIDGTKIRITEVALRAPTPMSHELAADLFAANAIVAARATRPAEARRLTDVVQRIELNVAATNAFANGMHGGALAIASWDPRREYADKGYTHPNLALRFRIVTSLLDPSPQRRLSVEEFIGWRQRIQNLPEP